MRTLLRLAPTVAVALVIVSCAASGSVAPSAVPSLASVEGSPSALPSASTDASDEGSPDLEALIPDEIGGVEVTKNSGSASGFVEGGEGEPALLAFLGALVEDVPDADLAVGFAFGDEVQSNLWVFRATGTDAGDLVRSLQAAFEAEGSLTGWEPSTVAGKDVLMAADPGEDGTAGSDDGRAYLYGTDAMVFFYATTDPEVAVEVFEALP